MLQAKSTVTLDTGYSALIIMPSSVRELLESDARHFMAAYLPRSKTDALFVGGLAEDVISGDQREKTARRRSTVGLGAPRNIGRGSCAERR